MKLFSSALALLGVSPVLTACAAQVSDDREPNDIGVVNQAATNCAPSGNLALNGNFEAQLASWTTSGAVAPTFQAYSGSYAAEIGNPTPTAAQTSVLTQTLVLPSCGRPRLTLRYKSTCGSTTLDKELVTVTNTAGTVLTTVLNRCRTVGWTELVKDLYAYRGQTVNLRFEVQDDGNPTKPTLLSVDNIVVNNRVDDYQDYIMSHPQVLVDALSDMNFGQRSTFSSADYQTFWNAAASLEATKKLPAIPAAEKTAVQDCIQSMGNPFACSNYFQARNLAYALWLELNRLVPWSLAEYWNSHLTYLLSLMAKPQSEQYWQVLIQPDRARSQFLTYAMAGQQLSTRRDLENRMAQWIRDHIVHETTPTNFTDIAQFLNGPTNCDPQAPGKMCVGSCWGNNHFMTVIAVAFNLPAVSTRYMGEGSTLYDHSFMDFPREGISLIHSDDLYSYNWAQNVPVNKVFLTDYEGPYWERDPFMQATTLQYYPPPSNPNDTETDRVRFKHNSMLYFQHPDALLLSHVCQGQAATMAWLQPWWGIPQAVMPDVSAIYQTWQSSLRAAAGCP